MFVRSILLGGAAALGASAMLVVPEAEPQGNQVETIEDDFVNIFEPMYPDVSYLVMMECKECPVREVDTEGVVSWSDGKPSTLFVDFHIEENRLLANDHQIFPPGPTEPITVTQYVEGSDEESGPMSAGYALEVTPQGHSHKEDGEILDVRFTILDLESHPIPVDTIDLTLVLSPNGELFLADGEIKETAPPAEKMSWKKCHGNAKCLQELLFDRVHGLVSAAKDRVMGMGGKKGCAGKHGKFGAKGDHHKDHKGHEGHKDHKHHDDEGFIGFENFDDEHHGHHGFHPEGMPPFPPPPFDEEFGPGPKGHHPHHHGDHFNPEMEDGRPPHHHMHGPPHGAFAHTFSRVVRFIVVPAVLGVLAGLTASAVGMLVGQAVIFLWQRYRGTKKQEHKAAWEDGSSCEKQGLMTQSSEECLPEYSEARVSEDSN